MTWYLIDTWLKLLYIKYYFFKVYFKLETNLDERNGVIFYKKSNVLYIFKYI